MKQAFATAARRKRGGVQVEAATCDMCPAVKHNVLCICKRKVGTRGNCETKRLPHGGDQSDEKLWRSLFTWLRLRTITYHLYVLPTACCSLPATYCVTSCL